MDHFDILGIKADRSDNPFQLNWAGTNDPNKSHIFTHFSEWEKFISRLSLRNQVP